MATEVERFAGPENTEVAVLEKLRRDLAESARYHAEGLSDIVSVFLAVLTHIIACHSATVFILNKRGSFDVRTAGEDSRYAESAEAALRDFPLTAPVRESIGSAMTLTAALWQTQLTSSQTLSSYALIGVEWPFGYLDIVSPPMDSTAAATATCAVSALVSAFELYQSRRETEALIAVSSLLAHTEETSDGESIGRIFKRAVEQIVLALRDCRAAVLRTMRVPDLLQISATANDPDVSWDAWENAEFRPGEFLAGQALVEGKITVIENPSLSPELFRNQKWIEANRLRSCICAPLMSGGLGVGTITLYFGVPVSAATNNLLLVEALTERLASAWGRYRANVDRQKAAAELDEMRFQIDERRMSYARRAGARATLQHYRTLLHRTKNMLTDVVLALRLALRLKDAERAVRIENAIQTLKSHEERLIKEARSGPRIQANINDLIKEIAEGLRVGLTTPNVAIDLNLQPLPLVRIDPDELREIVENLATNSIRAVRAAKRERGRVILSTRLLEHESDRFIEISVWDNGHGIAPGGKKRIFEEGFTTAKEIGGTGEGLPIVKYIVEHQYHGGITCESDEGAWTCFVVQLPLWALAI